MELKTTPSLILRRLYTPREERDKSAAQNRRRVKPSIAVNAPPTKSPTPMEAFAAILSEPELTNPQQDRSEAEHQTPPTPHDLKISASTGPPMSRMAADSRGSCVPGGFLVAISL
jgi:hypothetical protein